ncbi:hypothetical protein ABI59_02660 [Acidobacteria bacterium Mor1]|nr:hypothetical protein ABI59_02660 [Acidobacteria bacterium Mor1]
MSDPVDDPRTAPLDALQGSPAPPPVLDGWRRLARFPDGALKQWWALLEPAVVRPTLLEDGVRVAEFAQMFGLGHEDVRMAVQATAFLVTQSMAIDLAGEKLAADLEKLGAKSPEAAKIVADGYEERRPRLRELIVEWSLADHGNLLVGLDWRVDEIKTSSHGAELNTPVVLMTLKYRGGDGDKRLTLQLTPSAMQRLTEFVGRFTD